MHKQNHIFLQTQVEKKSEKRTKKKRKNMKVSGAGVKNLQKIILGR